MSILGIIASSRQGAPTAPVAGYTAWFDAADTATISLSGSNVTQWNDKSANAYNLVQGNNSFRPQSGTRTINSKNVIDYNGSTDTLNASTAANWTFLNNSTGSTVFIMISLDVLSNYLLLRTQGGNNQTIGYAGSTTASPCNWQHVITNGGDYFCLNRSTSTLSANTPAIFVIKSDPNASPAADKSSIFKNSGTAEKNNTTTGSASASAPFQPLRVGDYEEGGTLAPDGVYGEIIFYNSQLSDADISSNVTYLSNKWGI
jgi:hypothetical protein